jgi:Arc/MetJ-type ribon-helix-helix transcriptional regulator
MGRPPLGNILTSVRLPKSVMDRIDRLVGKNRRAAFIRAAVEDALARKESDKD